MNTEEWWNELVEDVKVLVELEKLGYEIENGEIKNVRDVNYGVIMDAVDLLKKLMGIKQ